MKKYNLIFLSNRTLLSKKQYSDWRDIQNQYENYMASVEFETLDELENYITLDYKISSERVKCEVDKLNQARIETVKVDLKP